MKKIALFSVIALSALMVGCSTTQTRECDSSKPCDPASCTDTANCDPSSCDKPACPKKGAACPTEAKAANCCGQDGCEAKAECDKKAAAGCPTEGKKAGCPSEES